MNWFNDKKNLPVIVVLIIVVIAAAGGFIAYENGAFTPSQEAAAPAVDPNASKIPVDTAKPPAPPAAARRPDTGYTPPMSGGKPAKGVVAGKPAATTPGGPVAPAPGDTTSLTIARGPDPFHLPGTPAKPPKNVVADVQLPPIPDPLLARWHDLPAPGRKVSSLPPPTGVSGADTSGRRMSGVLFGNGVYALLQTGDKTEAVQPGDTVAGGTVVAIDATSVTLKLDNDRLVTVPLGSSGLDSSQ